MNLPFLQVEDFEMEGYSASGVSFKRLCIYSCMDSATTLLWATASTTVLAPFTTSPEAKCPGGWYDRFHRLSEVPGCRQSVLW